MFAGSKCPERFGYMCMGGKQLASCGVSFDMYSCHAVASNCHPVVRPTTRIEPVNVEVCDESF